MSTYTLKITSPDGVVFEDSVEMLSLRGAAGDLAVLAGHMPFVTSVQKGVCKVVLADGSEKTAATDGGLLTVGKEESIFLSDTFRWEE